MQLGIRELAGAVDRNEQIEFPFLCSHFGNVDVEITDRILLKLFLGRFFSIHRWQATDVMPLE